MRRAARAGDVLNEGRGESDGVVRAPLDVAETILYIPRKGALAKFNILGGGFVGRPNCTSGLSRD